jgi:hypothetical protein
MTDIPNLGGVITPDDISRKGTGSYTADYVNWAKIAHLLHQNANGWQFSLRPSPEGGHVWRAPNGTAYVVGYFTNGVDETPDFPQACMDNRNSAIEFEKISARTLTDSHRRCLCTAAAFTFGLGYELWAKVEVENPMRDEAQEAKVEVVSTTSASEPASKPNGKRLSSANPERLSQQERDELVQAVVALAPAQREQVVAAFKQRFSIPEKGKAADYVKTAVHRDFLLSELNAASSK